MLSVYFYSMQPEFIIVGQGICGTWLSYYLQKVNKSFLVIDNNQPNTSSRIAAGIINPVTGRRIVKTWMIDEFIPFIKEAYNELGNDLGITAISQKNIIEFFPNPFMRESFLKRFAEDSSYLQHPEDDEIFKTHFNYEFGYGEIVPAFTAHLETILPAWRKSLQSKNCLLEESLETNQLKIGASSVEYKNIKADKIIFCDGIAAAENPLFRNLPFSFNKGEALIVEIPGLQQKNIYKKGITLAPLAQEGLFWAGSNYLWDFTHSNPTEEFRIETEKQLQSWLKIPFTIIDHKASIRPANVERRPFVGMHPVHKNTGILNGMGTKGCSLAPYFAKQLADHLIYSKEILPEADVKRFSKTLAR